MSDNQQYENLRCRLIRAFSQRGARDAEDLTSETIFRVLRNTSQGLYIERLDAYAAGVARNVWLEECRGRSRETAVAKLVRILGQSEQTAKERESACLERCLHGCLRRNETRLIQAYYGGSPKDGATRREQLAQKLGISANALRLKAMAIRLKLRACVKKCLEEEEF